jgi:hypothetical protein
MTDAADCADFVLRVNAFVADAKAKAADGLSWDEFGEILVSLLHVATSSLDDVRSLTGPEKKELVMEAVAGLFDAVAGRLVPMAAYPIWFAIRPTVRFIVLAIASGALESLLPLVRSAA